MKTKITLLFLTGIFLSAISPAQINSTGFQFDGIDDYVRIPTIPAYNIGTGNFTVEMWLRMSRYQVGGSTFLLNCPGPNPTFDPSTLAISMSANQVSVIVGSGASLWNTFIGISFNDNLCHHLALVRSAGSLTLYKDGILFQTQSAPASVTIPNYIQLGTVAPFNSYCGFMQEFRFWNVARTQSQIQANMNTSPSGAGLIGYWKLDNIFSIINPTTWDYSINNNPGQVFGPTTLAGCSNCTLPADTIYAPNSTVGCNSVQLVAQAGNTNYKWYKDNFGNAILVSIGSSTYSATVSETYFCLVTNSCGTVMTNKISVTVQTGSPSAVITGPTTFCSPGSVLLKANTGPGLTYQWRLNSGNIAGATSVTYAAASSGNYDCIVTNACTSAVSNTIAVSSSGPCDLGLQFNSSASTQVTINDHVSYAIGTGDFTIEAWIKASTSQSASSPTIISKGATANNVRLHLVSNGQLAIGNGGASFGGGSADLRDNICHHVAVTRTGTVVRFYVDGVQTGTFNSYNANITSTNAFWVGKNEVGGFQPFNGLIHEFRFWNLARSQAQIQSSKDFFLSGTESGLIGYWRMNDGSGQMVQDFSATNNSGVLGTSTAVESTDPAYSTACVTSNPCVAPPAVITASGPTIVCIPGSVTLNANTGPGLFYQWRLNGGDISGANAFSYVASAAGNYDCVETNACGSVASNTINIAINPPPTISISAAGPTAFCAPGSVTLNANPSSGLSYQWRLNNVDIPGATSSSYVATTAGLYRCRGSDATCSSTSNAITVTVVSSPPTATITANGPTTFCTPGSVMLSVSTCTSCTYQWRMDGVNITGAISSVRVITVSGNYDCIVTNACGSTTSNAIAVTVNSPPTATITPAGPTSFCSPGSVTLNANTGPGLSYQWRLNGGNISGATTSSYAATAGGNYDCIVSNSCGSATSNVIAVTTNPAPLASITAAGATIFCSPGSVTLNANTGTGLSYQWRLNGGNIPGATASSYAATATGNYDCIVSNSCGNAASSIISVTAENLASSTVTTSGPTTFCNPGSVTIYADHNILYSYQWLLNGLPAPGPFATSSAYIATTGGTYNCFITNTCGTQGSDLVTVTVLSLPSAVITAAGATTFCAPGSVTLNANIGTGLIYQWRLNNGPVIGATSSSYVASAAGNYDCIVTNSCGSTTSNSITVTINSAPSAVITAAGPTTYCAPGSVTLNANTSPGLSYQWRLNSVSIGGEILSSYIASAGGNYDCIVSNSCGSATSNTITVVADVLPLSAASAAGPTTFCAPGSVTLNVSTCTGCTYQWRTISGNIPGATSSSYSATASNDYGCLVTNTCGTRTSNSITVTVDVSPSASITAAGPTSFCAPGSVTLNANAGSGLSYQWRLNGGSISGATSLSYNATSAGNYNCVVSNSCGSATSNVISVTVNTLPAAVITAAGPTSVCSPISVTLNANTGAGLSYQWRLNTVNISGATTSSYNAVVTGNYSCVVTNSCGSATSNTIAVTVAVLPATPGSITGQATGVCSSTKTYSISSVSGATGYTWTVPAGASISSGQGTTSVNVVFTSSFGSGNVSVVATNTCGSSGASSLAVTGIPAQPGSITGPVSVCHNQNNVLYSIALVPGATSYTWTVPTGAQIKNGQGSEQIRVRFGNSAGNITVRANNSCGQSAIRTLSIAMPCREEITDDNFDVTLYPNPAANQITIYDLRFTIEKIEIFDAVGQRFFSQRPPKESGQATANSQQMIIDISSLTPGIYFAEIISGEQKRVLKFIKQK